MSEPRSALPWEVKTAQAVLGLLILELLRQLVVFLLLSPGTPDTAHDAFSKQMFHGGSEYRITESGTGIGALLFFAIYLGLIIGLWLRSPLALLMGLLLAGGAGLVNALFLLPSFRDLLAGSEHTTIARAYVDPQERFWLICRIAMQFSVPALLIVAKLRGRLKDWD